jgi:hypothetical protein
MLVGETWKYITYDDPVEVSLWGAEEASYKGYERQLVMAKDLIFGWVFFPEAASVQKGVCP